MEVKKLSGQEKCTKDQIFCLTRMHSDRLLTVCLLVRLGVHPLEGEVHPRWGEGASGIGGHYIQRVHPGGMHPRDVHPRGAIEGEGASRGNPSPCEQNDTRL